MNIRELDRKDVRPAAVTLHKAFQHDPIFHYIFGSEQRYQELAPWVFSTWVEWSVRFGKAWSTEEGEAVLLMRAIHDPGMSLASMIRSGMLPTPFKLGWSTFRRFYFGMVTMLEHKNKEIMRGQPHWYGWMLGSLPEHRGKGLALLEHCFHIADQERLPIYLETSISRNVRLYKHFGFELKDQVHMPGGDFDLFFMVRPAQ